MSDNSSLALVDAWIKVKAVIADLRAEKENLKGHIDALRVEIDSLRNVPPAPPVVSFDTSILDTITAEMISMIPPAPVVAPPVVEAPVPVVEAVVEAIPPVIEERPVPTIERTAPAPQ